MWTTETGNHDAWYLAEHLDRVARLDEDALEQLAKALWPEEGKVGSGSNCEEGLICANVRSSLLPTNVLFPGLKDHTECSLFPVESRSHADQSAWQLTNQVLPTTPYDSQCESTEVHLGRYRLTLSYDDVGPVFARRFQSSQRHRIKAHDRQSPFRMTYRGNVCDLWIE